MLTAMMTKAGAMKAIASPLLSLLTNKAIAAASASRSRCSTSRTAGNLFFTLKAPFGNDCRYQADRRLTAVRSPL